MGRRDPTYTGGDLIRFWINNLNKEEQEDVRCFFILFELEKKKSGAGLNQIIDLLLKLIPFVGNAILLVEEIGNLVDTLSSAAECVIRLKKIARRRLVERPE